ASILLRFFLHRNGLWMRLAFLRPGHPELPSRHASTPPPGTCLSWHRPSGERDGALALFILCALASFILSRYGTYHAAPVGTRYLLPLYTATPLIIDLFMPRRPRQFSIAVAVVLLASLLAAEVALTFDATPRVSIAPLVQ